MAINNYKCDVCGKSAICKNKSKLDKFSSEAKNDLGIEITFVGCDYLDETSSDSVGYDVYEDEEV